MGGYHFLAFFFFFFLVSVFCCFTFSVLLSSWLKDHGCCVCLFVFSLFSLSLVLLSRSF